MCVLIPEAFLLLSTPARKQTKTTMTHQFSIIHQVYTELTKKQTKKNKFSHFFLMWKLNNITKRNKLNVLVDFAADLRNRHSNRGDFTRKVTQAKG